MTDFVKIFNKIDLVEEIVVSILAVKIFGPECRKFWGSD